MPVFVESGLKQLQGLPEFLKWLDSRALRKGAVTNAPKANALMMLGALHLDKYFEVGYRPASALPNCSSA